MTALPPLWLLLLWTAWVLQAWLSAGQARRYLRLFRGKHHDHDLYQPRATVIVPFKGIDHDLPTAMRSLCQQDYPDYELLLVVDSAEDPAYPILRRELARYPQRQAQLLIAGAASRHEGQKVHNQLFALERIYDRSADGEVWVFADSDAIPGPQWLAKLVSPLAQVKKTGLTTGYRWLIPQPPRTIWSHLASLMNGSVAGLMGRDQFNHAWGGSMAIRAEIARRGDLRGRLAGALCDDYQFTRLARDLGLRVYFVPGCLVASPVRFDGRGLVNFVHRQYLLTRVYAPFLFAAALTFTSLYVAGAVSTLVYLVISLLSGRAGLLWPVGVLALAGAGDQLRAYYRRQAIDQAFGYVGLARLRATLTLDRWATPLWMTAHWLLILRSAFGRTMRWRGILYRLDGPQKCRRLES